MQPRNWLVRFATSSTAESFSALQFHLGVNPGNDGALHTTPNCINAPQTHLCPVAALPAAVALGAVSSGGGEVFLL